MIVVDTTIWIQFLRASESPEDHHLQQLIVDGRALAVTDFIFCEILQGIPDDSPYDRIRSILLQYPILRIGSLETVEHGAKIYRTCRRRGFTIRKTIECLIASVCLQHDCELFHNDSDSDLIANATALKIYRISLS